MTKYSEILAALAIASLLQDPAAAVQQPPHPAHYSFNSTSAVSPNACEAPAKDQASPSSAAMAELPDRIIYHDEIAVPADRLFSSLESEFAAGALGPYQVVRSDPRTRTLILRRASIDPDNWSKWTYCNVPPPIDGLQDGTVTITIRLDPTGRMSFTTVSAEFAGRYGAGSSKGVRCVSRGVLEEGIVAMMAQEEGGLAEEAKVSP